jgi:hypothetical protein
MTTESAPSSSELNQFNPAEAVEVLDRAVGFLPRATLLQCQRHREQITPHLIKAIERATERVRSGEEVKGTAHDFALYLLWEFQAKEGLPALLAGISLPGEGPFDLFGDAITEDLPALLASLAADRLGVIEELISNRELNVYVRCSAATSYRYLVRDGQMPREEAVARLRNHLRSAIDLKDEEFVTLLVTILCDLNSQEARAEIREAFDKGLVEGSMMDRDFAEELIAAGEQGYQEAEARLQPTQLGDAAEHMQDWPCFDPAYEPNAEGYYQLKSNPTGTGLFGYAPFPSSDALKSDFGDDYEDDPSYLNTTTIRNEAPRIGRNDPCPCGSGKKYKKCCLRESPLK